MATCQYVFASGIMTGQICGREANASGYCDICALSFGLASPVYKRCQNIVKCTAKADESGYCAICYRRMQPRTPNPYPSTILELMSRIEINGYPKDIVNLLQLTKPAPPNHLWGHCDGEFRLWSLDDLRDYMGSFDVNPISITTFEGNGIDEPYVRYTFEDAVYDLYPEGGFVEFDQDIIFAASNWMALVGTP